MQSLNTYLIYRNHNKDVAPYRTAKQKEDAARREAFKNISLTPDELKLAKKRAEVFRRAIDELDEFSQTTTEDVETVTQTLLGESMGVLTAVGGALGYLYQKAGGGKRVQEWAQKTLRLSADSAKKVLPATIGFGFGVISSLPLLVPLTTIEIQTPRIARFEALTDHMSRTNDYAILTDEQEAKVRELAKDVTLPKAKSTQKGILESINIFSEIESYIALITKRTIYRNEKEDFEKKQKQITNALNNMEIPPEQLQKAKEDKAIAQRLVNKVDFEAQDYIERVFKIIDVTSMSLWSLGVVAGIAFDKLLDICKVPNGKIKTGVSIVSALAGVILLNSKLAEIRNNTIRIARHKQMNELLEDPTNFLAPPKNLPDSNKMEVKPQEKINLFSFLKEFKKDCENYEEYAKTTLQENKKFKIAARNIKLTEEQYQDAKLRKANFFKTINLVDDNKKKYEETFDIFATIISSPLGLTATAIGNAAAWLIHNIKKAPEAHLKYYSLAGTFATLLPAIGIELYTTIETRKASRVAYMNAQKDLNNERTFLAKPKLLRDESPFLKLSFRQGLTDRFQQPSSTYTR